jgi:hypothetical protein
MKHRKVTISQSGTILRNSSGYNLKQKASIRRRERLNRLAITKARKYLLFALACFIFVQIIKYFANSVLWPSTETPTGILFLFVTYLQIGLLLFTFIFIVSAAFQALKRIFSEFE